MLGTNAAQGALVIFGQLFALVNITTDIANVFFHTVSQPFFSFKRQFRHRPEKLS